MSHSLIIVALLNGENEGPHEAQIVGPLVAYHGTMESYVQLSDRTWPVGTTITVCSVPWDSGYRDIVQWQSAAARDDWIENHASTRFTVNNNTTIRPGRPLTLGLPYGQLYGCNYIKVSEAANPIPGDTPRTYCYFITAMDYASPHSTVVQLQLDVWTTYQFDVDFGYAFVERGHLGIANSNLQLNPQSLREYAAVPEGLDTGSQMAIVGQSYDNFGSNGWEAILSITSDLSKPAGTVDDPTQDTASGSIVDGMPSAADVYGLSTGLDLITLITGLSTKSWIGRNVQSIVLMPKKFVKEGSQITIHEDYAFTGASAHNVNGQNVDLNMGDMLSALHNALPARYQRLYKLCSYPFSVIAASNQAGANTLYKPQYLASGTLTFHCHCAIMPPFGRITAYLDGYDTQGSSDLSSSWVDPTGLTGSTVTVDSGDWIDNALVFDDWPQFSILNDSYNIYLASSAHSRAYSYEAAGWTRDKSQMGADLRYETNQRRMETARNQRNLQDAATSVNNLIGSAGAALGGDPAAGASGFITGGISQAANRATWEMGQEQQRWENDQNYQLANQVIQGDYQQTVAGIDATVQDASLTPPALAGATGGMGFNLSQGFIGLRVTAKQIGSGALSVVGEYMLRYGYAIRRTLRIPANLVCMSHFAYWKAVDTHLTMAAGTETDRTVIRAILEKGVTVWNTPEGIGNVDPGDNTPIGGYSY